MNIRKVSFGIVTSTLMAGALSGCTETKYEDNAKAQAVVGSNGEVHVTSVDKWVSASGIYFVAS